jgi:N-methylhydantoinase A
MTPPSGAPRRSSTARRCSPTRLIERKGAPTALITTRGFSRRARDRPRAPLRDVRPLDRAAEAAGAAPWLRFEVDERILGGRRWRGRWTRRQVFERWSRRAARKGIAAVAVCCSLLRTRLTSGDRRDVRRGGARGGACLSSEVVREIKRVRAHLHHALPTSTSSTWSIAICANCSASSGSSGRRRAVHHAVVRRRATSRPPQASRCGCSNRAPRRARWPPRTTARQPATRPAVVRHGRHHGEAVRDRRRANRSPAPEFEVDRVYRFKKGSGPAGQGPVIEMIEIGAGGGSIARVDEPRAC